MSVWLRNFQKAISFNEHLLKLHCGFLMHVLGAGRFDLSVVCVEDGEIRELNRVYRNVDSSTDVLSFPYHEVNGSSMRTFLIVSFPYIHYHSVLCHNVLILRP